MNKLGPWLRWVLVFTPGPLLHADLIKSVEELDKAARKSSPAASAPAALPQPGPAPLDSKSTAPAPVLKAKSPAPPSVSKPVASDPKPYLNSEDKKLTFTSDKLIGSKRLGSAELVGNVKINHGDLFMQSRKAQMIFDQEGKELQRVIATGDVVLEKKALNPAEAVYASGEKIEYDRPSEMIYLTEKAFLKQGADVVRGDVIQYNLATGIVTAQQVQGKVSPNSPAQNQSSPAPKQGGGRGK